MKSDRIICGCYDVYRSSIETAIREQGLKTVEDVGLSVHLGRVCGVCSDSIQEVLHDVNSK